MRESRTYGSVRGAPSDGRPYRDPAFEAVIQSAPPAFFVPHRSLRIPLRPLFGFPAPDAERDSR